MTRKKYWEQGSANFILYNKLCFHGKTDEIEHIRDNFTNLTFSIKLYFVKYNFLSRKKGIENGLKRTIKLGDLRCAIEISKTFVR